MQIKNLWKVENLSNQYGFEVSTENQNAQNLLERSIVTVASASKLPVETAIPIKFEHSNHLEKRNNSKSKKVFDFLLNGNSGLCFKTVFGF